MTETKPGRLPLYKKVTDQLREQCFASSGEMLPSLRQLSQMLDVNHATISRALRDLEQEGIVEIVPRKGIFSVSRPVAEANIELVVFLNDRTNLLDVALRIFEGMSRASQKSQAAGMNLKVTRSVLSVPPLPEVDRFIAELRSRGTIGIVCLGFGFLEGELARDEENFIAAVAQKMPVVLAGSPHPVLELDCVYGDPHLQMQEFLQHCYDQGLRRFEYLGDRGDNQLQRQRREDFQSFMSQNNLNWEWSALKTQDTPQLAESLRGLPDLPEVVVATNVRRALTITLEAQRRGYQLPQDLHVLCFASLLEHAQPLLPYTSVVMMDEPEVGTRAVQLLQQKIKLGKVDARSVERVPAHFASGPLHRAEALFASAVV
jgi:DNA-binding LacI/PurR family transcriptional regulator